MCIGSCTSTSATQDQYTLIEQPNIVAVCMDLIEYRTKGYCNPDNKLSDISYSSPRFQC